LTKLEKNMNSEEQTRASNLLWNAWMAGEVMKSLPENVRPKDRQEGYAIQSLLEAHSQSQLYGWKIAATSAAGQKHIGVNGPIAGRLLKERVHLDGSSISLLHNRMQVAECEFAFKMKRTLEPRATSYLIDEVMDAVGSLHPAIEIPDSRFSAFERAGEAQLIADAACAHSFILGSAATCNWRSVNLATHTVTASITQTGARLTHYHGVGANVLGDPRIALTWLANELSGLGIALGANQVVTTGTCMTPIAVAQGDHLAVGFGPIGEVRCSFVA
jgi:2-keto-4-pentenoate hydratase